MLWIIAGIAAVAGGYFFYAKQGQADGTPNASPEVQPAPPLSSKPPETPNEEGVHTAKSASSVSIGKKKRQPIKVITFEIGQENSEPGQVQASTLNIEKSEDAGPSQDVVSAKEPTTKDEPTGDVISAKEPTAKDEPTGDVISAKEPTAKDEPTGDVVSAKEPTTSEPTEGVTTANEPNDRPTAEDEKPSTDVETARDPGALAEAAAAAAQESASTSTAKLAVTEPLADGAEKKKKHKDKSKKKKEKSGSKKDKEKKDKKDKGSKKEKKDKKKHKSKKSKSQSGDAPQAA
ncbi:aminopeptidase N [Aphelenchoides avenae]|nr:aminopeptidase N [Aphelenchus avenae]